MDGILLSVLKLSAFQTGLMPMPMTVGMMLASFIAPKMAMKTGHSRNISDCKKVLFLIHDL